MRSTIRRPGLIIALVCLPVFLGALDLTVISAVLPAVIADLQIPLQSGLDTAAWVVSGYLLAYAISMTFMGRVSDLWGRQRVFLVCLVIFFFGSWWVADAMQGPTQAVYRLVQLVIGGRPDRSMIALYALIAGRILQAFGAGAMVPVSMALVADLYPAEQRAIPLGIIGAVDTGGWVLGHLYGGIMVQFFPWTYLFWVNLPVVLIAFGLILWALRGLREQKTGRGMDWVGILLLTLVLVGLNLGLGNTQTGAEAIQSQTSQSSTLALLVGIISLLLFIWVEQHAKAPLINLRLFKDHSLSAASSLNLIIGFCLMVGLVSVPLFINVASGQNTEKAALVSGYLLSAFTIPMAAFAIPGGWLTRKAGYRTTVTLGVLVAMLGFFLMNSWQPEMATQAVEVIYAWSTASNQAISGVLYMVSGLLAVGIGLGMTIAPIGTTVINAVAESERGIAAALVIILRLIGMSISVSTLTTYGLQRTTELSREMLVGVSLTEAARIADAAVKAATQVTAEMALIAAFLCLAAILPALWLKGKGLS